MGSCPLIMSHPNLDVCDEKIWLWRAHLVAGLFDLVGLMGVWLEDPNQANSPDDLSGLADAWDQCKEIRHGTTQRKSMLTWLTPKGSGHINFETLQLNVKVMKILVSLWCPKSPEPKTVGIDHLKWQAGIDSKKTR